MDKKEIIRVTTNVGMGLLFFAAYLSVIVLSFDLFHSIRGKLIPTRYPWWAIVYIFFITCYASEQWRTSSTCEKPKLMAAVTIINCILLYLYW